METYMDTNLSPEERAKALLAELSLDEKMAQVNCFLWGHGGDENAFTHGIGQISTLEIRDIHTLEEAAQTIYDLQKKAMEKSPHHIPAVFHMEGLCGGLIQEATSFPSGIGRASSFDVDLEKKIGEIVGRQERAMGITQTLAPVLDISRDSRMGRQCETYGEDPTLAAAMGAAYTKGVQQQSAGRQTDAMAKHFLAFHDSLGAIHGASVEIGEALLREVYGKPFQAAITESNLRGIMPCYCSINGRPASASKKILTKLLREEMGFDGVAGADYSAIGNVHSTQNMFETKGETGLACMDAGMDVELPNTFGYGPELKEMFENGTADMQILDQAVYRVLCAKFRMGLFEHPFSLLGEQLRAEFHQEQDEAVTFESAQESLVLLKNENQALPLQPEGKKIAAIGCHWKNGRFFFGGYTHVSMVEALHAAANSLAGVDASNVQGAKPMKTIPGTQVQSDETEEFAHILEDLHPGCPSLLEELSRQLPDQKIQYAYGYPIAGTDDSHFAEALEVCKDADIILLTLGGKNGSGSIATMGEGVDGTNINLPWCQDEFIKKAAELGKPMIGIHLDGRPISSDVADQYLDAILEAWNPSEKGAEAIVNVLLGKYNPSGKMPVTVAYHAGQIPVYYNHPSNSSWHQGESIGFADYVDLPHRPRYYFGHGLSYTQFDYEDLRIAPEAVDAHGSVEISFVLTNAGSVAGTEIPQLYLRDPHASMVRPVKELVGFSRVSLEPGESKVVTFQVSPSQMAFLDEDLRWMVESGALEVMIGSSSEDIRLQGDFHVNNTCEIDGKTRKFYSIGECKEK